MEQLLQDVANVERLGSEFASTYARVSSVCSFLTVPGIVSCPGVTDFALLQVKQCSSDIQGLTAALAALQGTQTKSEQVWVHRPGGLVLGLGHDHAIQVLKDGMHADCFALPKGTLNTLVVPSLTALCRLDVLQGKTTAATAKTKSSYRAAGRSRGSRANPARCSGIAKCSGFCQPE